MLAVRDAPTEASRVALEALCRAYMPCAGDDDVLAGQQRGDAMAAAIVGASGRDEPRAPPSQRSSVSAIR